MCSSRIKEGLGMITLTLEGVAVGWRDGSIKGQEGHDSSA